VEDSVVITVLLPLALAVIMVSLGLSLTVADFRRVILLPRGVAIGLANLLVVSPLLAFAVAEAYGLTPALAVGLVLLGASPGGTTANLLTHLARGDTALSVTMTAVSSVAAVVTVPLYLGLAIDHFDATGLGGDISVAGIVVRVFLITVVPLSIGMWLRSRSPERVAEIEPRARKVALGVFLVVVAGAVIAERETVLDNFAAVAAAALTLNVLAMSVSYTVARLAKLDGRQATAIAMELGVHNATLAIAVGATVATVLTVPAAVYSVFMYLTAGLFARFMYRRNVREPDPVPV
jgi:BASS family bile acid:Na+ symporter